MKNFAVVHIPRTAGRWVKLSLKEAGLLKNCYWGGHNPRRRWDLLQQFATPVVTMREPIAWYSALYALTKDSHGTLMAQMSENGVLSLPEAMWRMSDANELRKLSRFQSSSFFKTRLYDHVFSEVGASNGGLWYWALDYLTTARYRYLDYLSAPKFSLKPQKGRGFADNLKNFSYIRHDNLHKDFRLLFGVDKDRILPANIHVNEGPADRRKFAQPAVVVPSARLAYEADIWSQINLLGDSQQKL